MTNEVKPLDVLVVEDNDDERELLMDFVAAQGLSVMGAADGAEGLAAVSRHDPQLVLLDLHMPTMSGWEFLACLRQWEANGRPSTAIVVCSGWYEPHVSLGDVLAQFIKPLDVRQLQAVLQRFFPR